VKIAVIGAGHVGLVTGACFAELGHEIFFVDNDKSKIEKLKKGEMPFHEPGLEDLLNKNKERIKYFDNVKNGVKDAEVIFIAVGTPSREDGEADLSAVERVTTEIAETSTGYKLVVEKSTVPVRTGERIKFVLNLRKKEGAEFDVASNPEFLREGSAVYDFFNPDRIVIGVESERAEKILRKIYEPIKAPILVTDIESAELIKHASNSFLAMKISYINAISIICDKVGANIKKVAEGIGLDRRIGKEFLNAGVGFGGYCFPKDLKAFYKICEKLGFDFKLLKEVEKINIMMRERFVEKIEDILWNLQDKVIGILGLSYKPNTDDLREAPSVYIIEILKKKGAKIKAYDPVSMDNAKKIYPDIEYCKDPYEVAENADCLCIITEWEEFKNLDLKKIRGLMRTPVIADGRNIFERSEVEKLGFIYRGVGQ